MKLKHDFIIDLATGYSRTSKKWRNRQWRWSELLERCMKKGATLWHTSVAIHLTAGIVNIINRRK